VRAVAASPEGVHARLSGLRKRWRPVDVALDATGRDTAVGGGILAGAVAFRLFLFLLPFAFVLVAGFGIAADAAGREPRELAEAAGAAGLIASTIESVAHEFPPSRGRPMA
jgi:hypothetical protein